MSDASSELLREALVDLQRVRDRESNQRAQVETLLATLRAVVNAGLDDPFGPMLALLGERLEAPDVLMLSVPEASAQTLVVRGSIQPDCQAWAWPAGGPTDRALRGKVISVADAAQVPSLEAFAPVSNGRLRSLLLIGVQSDEGSGLLVCGHPEPNHFGRPAIRLARELALVVSESLTRWHARQREQLLLEQILEQNRALQAEIKERQRAEEEARRQREEADRLLHTILPAPIVHRLKQKPGVIADSIEQATVMFTDLVGFTELSTRFSPEDLVAMLNRIFSRFDALTRQHGIERIKTIGDAYMVGSGVLRAGRHDAASVAHMALQMRQDLLDLAHETEIPLMSRIGIHTGPLVAGVIGTQKFSYDVWGDTVNVASRMESHGVPGEIQVTDAARRAIGDRFRFRKRGTVHVKGKGGMRTHFLVGLS